MSSISRVANALGRAYSALPSEPDGATYRRMKVLARNALEDRQTMVDFDGVAVPLCVLQDHIAYIEEQRTRIGNALYVFENNVFHWRTP